MSNIDDSFKKMADALNSNFEHIKELKDDINSSIDNTVSAGTNCTSAENENRELQTINNSMTLKDSSYLDKEIKDLIDMSKDVLTQLKDEIKLGAAPRYYEVYATLSNSITQQIQELRQLNKMILDTMVFNADDNDNEEKNNKNIYLTGEQLIDVVDKARKNSSMNVINAEFEVSEDDLK